MDSNCSVCGIKELEKTSNVSVWQALHVLAPWHTPINMCFHCPKKSSFWNPPGNATGLLYGTPPLVGHRAYLRDPAVEATGLVLGTPLGRPQGLFTGPPLVGHRASFRNPPWKGHHVSVQNPLAKATGLLVFGTPLGRPPLCS